MTLDHPQGDLLFFLKTPLHFHGPGPVQFRHIRFRADQLIAFRAVGAFPAIGDIPAARIHLDRRIGIHIIEGLEVLLPFTHPVWIGMLEQFAFVAPGDGNIRGL